MLEVTGRKSKRSMDAMERSHFVKMGWTLMRLGNCVEPRDSEIESH